MNYYRLRARKQGPFDSERTNTFLGQDYKAMEMLDDLLARDAVDLNNLLEDAKFDGLAYRLAGVMEMIQ